MNDSRIILHVDFNSFFASVEQQANPFLRGKPIAVAGKGKNSIDIAGRAKQTGRFRVDQHNLHRTVITTASIEAKQRGVKTAMSSIEAKRICPELIVIPGDPRKYSAVTNRFLAILKRHASAVEQFSLDEAFADITMEAQDYFGATMIAQMIRSDIVEEIGAYCTASIGIASSKVMAKLAGESAKPSGLTVVQPHEAAAFVERMPLQAVCGIGPKIAERLAGFGVTSMRALRTVPRPALVNEFHDYGNFLFDIARGLGDDFVNPVNAPPKSIGHSYTFATDLDTTVELQTNLLALADKVATRMRRDGFSATTVHAYARYAGGGSVGGQIAIQNPLNNGFDVYTHAWSVLDSKRDTHKAVRLLGVSVSGLVAHQAEHTLFDQDNKKGRVLESLDKLQDKYGGGIWMRASTMKTEFKERVSGWHYDHEV